MRWLITKADFLGIKPSIKINQESRSKNLFSGGLSIITCLLIVSLTLYFLIQLIQRTESTMVYNSLPTLQSNQNLSDLPYMVGLFAASTGKLIGDEYYTLVSHYGKMKYINGTQSLERIVVKQETCDLNKHFGKYRSYFESLTSINLYYCPIPGKNDLNLLNPFGGNLDYFFIAHYYIKCTNNTALNKTNCKPQQEIDSALSSVYTTFKFLEYSLDHSNPDSAGSLYMRSDSNPVSSSLSTRMWFYITNVEYYSDVGFLFEDLKQESFFYYSKPLLTYSLGACSLPGCFANIVLTMESKFEKYTKTYTKLQNFLANVGGILKGVLFCAEAISYFFNTRMYNHELITSIFKIETGYNKKSQVKEDVKNLTELR